VCSFRYFLTSDLKEVKKRIVRWDFRHLGFLQAAKYKIAGPPSLPTSALEDERDGAFCMALLQLDYKAVEPERVLQTIYRDMTGDKLSCPRFGSHWEALGFQGKDPATDLRGAGLFGLVQWLFFLKTHRPLLLRIFKLSKDDVQARTPVLVCSCSRGRWHS
jgi:ELMO domain-containing protein